MVITFFSMFLVGYILHVGTACNGNSTCPDSRIVIDYQVCHGNNTIKASNVTMPVKVCFCTDQQVDNVVSAQEHNFGDNYIKKGTSSWLTFSEITPPFENKIAKPMTEYCIYVNYTFILSDNRTINTVWSDTFFWKGEKVFELRHQCNIVLPYPIPTPEPVSTTTTAMASFSTTVSVDSTTSTPSVATTTQHGPQGNKSSTVAAFQALHVFAILITILSLFGGK